LSADNRIEKAIELANTGDGPITRAPVDTLGSAEWWDALRAGESVRVVFSRYHGDSLQGRIGQGPVFRIPPRGEVVAPPPAQVASNRAPEVDAPTTGDGALFRTLRLLEREARADADARAERHQQALERMLISQAENQTRFYEAMTSMFVGERRASRDDERRSKKDEREHELRKTREVRETVARAVREALEESRNDDDDDDDDDDEAPPQDAIASALSGLGETVKPLVQELGRRAAKSAIG
jgi:hypothetical protein